MRVYALLYYLLHGRLLVPQQGKCYPDLTDVVDVMLQNAVQ